MPFKRASATQKDKPVITTEKHAPKKNELSSEKFMENVRHLVETQKDLLERLKRIEQAEQRRGSS